jgi:hypothetical protein
LTFVSGLTDIPVGGATVTVGTATYTTTEVGQITLHEAATAGTRLTVLAASFFDRQTLVRSAGAARFTLWPQTTNAGLDAPWTQELAYTYGARCCPATATNLGQAPLRRIRSGTTVELVIAGSLQREVVRQSAHAAADLVNVANEGRVVFQYAAAATTGLKLEVQLAPNVCGPGAVACMAVDTDSAGYITGGRLVFPAEPTEESDYATYLTRRYSGGELGYFTSIIAHELGHAVGLQHCLGPDRLGMMSLNADGAYHYWYYPTYHDFAPEEKRVLKLIYQRPAGNRFPDDETSVRATAAPESVMVCRLLAQQNPVP